MSNISGPENFEQAPDQTITITPEFAETIFVEITDPASSYDEFKAEELAIMTATNPHLANFCEELFARKMNKGEEQEAHRQYSGVLLAHRIIRKAADENDIPMPIAPPDKMLIFQDAARPHKHRVKPPKPDFVMPKNAGLQFAFEKLTNDSSRNGFIILASFFEAFLEADMDQV